MSPTEQALADDIMRAEIAKLIAETGKINAETSKNSRERFWIPFTVFAGVVVASISAAATITLRLLG